MSFMRFSASWPLCKQLMNAALWSVPWCWTCGPQPGGSARASGCTVHSAVSSGPCTSRPCSTSGRSAQAWCHPVWLLRTHHNTTADSVLVLKNKKLLWELSLQPPHQWSPGAWSCPWAGAKTGSWRGRNERWCVRTSCTSPGTWADRGKDPPQWSGSFAGGSPTPLAMHTQTQTQWWVYNRVLMFTTAGGCGSGGREGPPLIRRSVPGSWAPHVLGQDT